MMRFSALVTVFLVVGCGSSESGSSNVSNRLKDIYNEVGEFEHKRGYSPTTEEEFKQFLAKRHSNLDKWLSNISFANTFGLSEPSHPSFISRKKYAKIEKNLGGNLVLAYQSISKNDKYYVVYWTGRVDTLDSDDLHHHGVPVGKFLEKSREDDLRNQREIKEFREKHPNKTDKQMQKEADETRKKNEDATIEDLKKPRDNPFNEKRRKEMLEEMLKKRNLEDKNSSK